MGSLVAVEAASQSRSADAPARVERLVAIASAYPMQVSDALLDATRDDEPRAITMVSLWSSETSHGGFSQKPSSPAPGFGVVWGNRRLMGRQGPGVMHVDFVACNAYRNGETAAANVACPALFILGEKDAMTPARSGRALAKTIAGARVVELPGIGHNVMAEAPDAVLDTLRVFLAAT
jgi:pimeloyl-ACP methyl ester carboxylesterase